MAPLGRRRVHFKAAADGLDFLAAIFKDHDDIGQVLPYLLLDVFIRGRSFVWIPVAKLREANETCLLVQRDLDSPPSPASLAVAQNNPRPFLHSFRAQQKPNSSKTS